MSHPSLTCHAQGTGGQAWRWVPTRTPCEDPPLERRGGPQGHSERHSQRHSQSQGPPLSPPIPLPAEVPGPRPRAGALLSPRHDHCYRVQGACSSEIPRYHRTGKALRGRRAEEPVSPPDWLSGDLGTLAPRGITGCSGARRVRLRLLRDTSAAPKERRAASMTRATGRERRERGEGQGRRVESGPGRNR